jgi:hypothetical protein
LSGQSPTLNPQPPLPSLWLITAAPTASRPLLAFVARELKRRLRCEVIAGPAQEADFWRSAVASPRDAVALHGLTRAEAEPLLRAASLSPSQVLEIPDWGWLTPDPPPVEHCRERLRGWLAQGRGADGSAAVAADVPGLIWLGLSLRHEALSLKRDARGRVPAEAGLFGAADLRGEPQVDQAVAELLERLPTPFRENFHPTRRVCLTFDVDSLAFYPRFRSAVRAAFFGPSREGPRALARWLAIQTGRIVDPHREALERFAEALGHHNLPSTWLWMAARRHQLDPPPYLRGKAFQKALEALRRAGSVVEHGVHPSFLASERAEWIAEEKRLVEEAVGEEASSVRFHYLRWDHAKSPRMLAEAGFRVDSTLGFSEFGGFRAGTALPFELIDQRSFEPAGVQEVPLATLDSAHLYHERRSLEEFPRRASSAFGPRKALRRGIRYLGPPSQFCQIFPSALSDNADRRPGGKLCGRAPSRSWTRE